MGVKISADELQVLFDALPDVVFFVKDHAGRYTHANLTLVRRLGLKRREEVIGHSVTELFP
ncbi:MAG: PAS domain-containing protein, partial [Pseudomonadota bacterium]